MFAVVRKPSFVEAAVIKEFSGSSTAKTGEHYAIRLCNSQ